MPNISLGCSVVNNDVRKNVSAALRENRLGQGRFVTEFEQKVTKFVGAKHAVAVSNGSMADIVALSVLKQQRPGRTEVIVPALTFIAHVNAILVNGLKPVFCDIGEDLQINVEEIRKKTTFDTLAIFPVHLLGKKCNIEEIKKIGREEGIFVLEDSCEAFGLYHDTEFATYSFFPSHTITTGEGGMIVTNIESNAEWARKIANHGRKGDNILDKFHFDSMGFNGKMSNVLAAIGCGVVDGAGKVIEERKKNVEHFNKLMNGNWFADSPHGYPIFYESSEQRDKKAFKLGSQRH